METVQLAITDTSYGMALKETLVRGGTWEVVCVDVPDPNLPGVLVLDSAALERLPSSFSDPERVVLITRNDPEHLSRAWEAGIVSVVFDNDPINTAVLAIMAARLRVAKGARSSSTPPSRSSSAGSTSSGCRQEPNDSPTQLRPEPGGQAT